MVDHSPETNANAGACYAGGSTETLVRLRVLWNFTRPSVNAKSGVERARRTREEVAVVVPQKDLMRIWQRQEDFDEGDIECQQSRFVRLTNNGTCSSDGKVTADFSGKLKVKCKKVDAVTTAENMVKPDAGPNPGGGLTCDGPDLDVAQVTEILATFLDDKGALSFSIKDDVCTLTEVDELPGGL